MSALTLTRPPRCAEHGKAAKNCHACKVWHRWYNQHRRQLIRAGKWDPCVPVERLRPHIATLRQAGMSITEIANRVGVHPSTVQEIATLQQRQIVTPAIAEAILMVEPATGSGYMVDAAGTHRRLRALAANGWSLREVSTRMGLHSRSASNFFNYTQVCGATAAKVAAIYDELADLPGTSIRTKMRAAAKGWPDPTWWADMGGIDDPAAPERTEVEPDPDLIDPVAVELALQDPTRARDLTKAERVLYVRAGRDRGMTLTALAGSLRTNTTAIRALLDQEPAAGNQPAA